MHHVISFFFVSRRRGRKVVKGGAVCGGRGSSRGRDGVGRRLAGVRGNTKDAGHARHGWCWRLSVVSSVGSELHRYSYDEKDKKRWATLQDNSQSPTHARDDPKPQQSLRLSSREAPNHDEVSLTPSPLLQGRRCPSPQTPGNVQAQPRSRNHNFIIRRQKKTEGKQKKITPPLSEKCKIPHES